MKKLKNPIILIVILATISLLFLFPGTFVKALFLKESQPPTRYTLYTVESGNTLWQISERFMPDTDPRLGVYWIKGVNYLDDQYVIQPGDEINVPDEDGAMAEPWGQD